MKSFKMKLRNFILIFALMISIGKMNQILGVENEKIEFIGGDSKNKRNGLHRLSEHNFIIVYFSSSSSEMTYASGFLNKCSERDKIEKLAYNNTNFNKDDPLTITPSSQNEIFIYFSDDANSLSYIFSSSCDSNSQYITKIDFSHFDSSSIINMENIFSGCSSLSTLDVSNLNKGQVIKMNSMFSGCSSLSTLNI